MRAGAGARWGDATMEFIAIGQGMKLAWAAGSFLSKSFNSVA